MSNNNIESYLSEDTVSYYKELTKIGCFKYESEIIKRYFPKNSFILDIGCGVGRTTIALKKAGFKVIGMDYSSRMIETAISIDKEIDYRVENVKNMNFNDESFDCIIFSFNGLMLLETYDERILALNEIIRVLKSDGIFFFTTPFLDNKIEKSYWLEKRMKYGKTLDKFSFQELIEFGDEIVEEETCKFNIHIPFIKEIHKALNKCGFKILFEGRRLDYFPEEIIEEELDDNYLWVVTKTNV